MTMPESEKARYGKRHSPGRKAFFRDNGTSMSDRLEEMKKYGNLEKAFIDSTKDPLGEGKKGLDPQYWKGVKDGYISGASAMLDEYNRKKEELSRQYTEALKGAKNTGLGRERRRALDEAALKIYDDGLRKLNYETWLAWEKNRKKIIEQIENAK